MLTDGKKSWCCAPMAALAAAAMLTPHQAAARPAVAFIWLDGAPPKTKITKFPFTITGFNVETGMVGEVEYDPSTCTEISPGSWAINGKPPHRGVIANTQGQGTVGGCGDTIFTYGVIDYTWTKKMRATSDHFKANWSTPDGQFNIPFKFILSLVK